MYSSTSLAMDIKSISIRPQVGHAIKVAALLAKPKALSKDLATLTSSTGSADNEIRQVFPMPRLKIAPKPADDLTVPLNNVPLSVIPKCNG